MSKAPRAREAVEFLRYMTSREMAGRFAKMRDIPVAVRGAMEGNVSVDLEELVEILERAKTSYGAPPGEEFPDIGQHWTDAREKLLSGKATPEELTKKLEQAARTVRRKVAHPDQISVRHRWKPALLLGILGAAIIYWLITTAIRIRTAAGQAATGTACRFRMSLASIVLFVGPALLLYRVFVIVPACKSLIWSVHRWDGLTSMQFVALLHFKRLLFENDGFWIALRNILFLMFVIPLFVLPLSLFLAACISRGVWGGRMFRIVFFFPNILGGVAATLLWLHLYNSQGGLVNSSLVGIGNGLSVIGLGALGGWFQGFAGFAWLAPYHLYWALIPMSIWGAAGFNMLLFLAAMESIPQSMCEAAELDGASLWHQF